MATIAHIVKDIIGKKPFIEEALSRGLINYGALAEVIKEEVETELKKEVKEAAIVMALRRYAEKIEGKEAKRAKFGEESDIMMRSGLIEVTVVKSPDSGELIRKLYDFVDVKKGDFISIVQGINEISVITNKKHEKNFLENLKKSEIKAVSKNLSSLTIKLPKGSTEMIGIFYMITKELSWENISIIEVISTWGEMTCIVRTEDAPHAFKVLDRLIKENR